MSANPAQRVIEKFGGASVVAAVTGKHISRVFRWTYSKARGGTDGFIPWPDAVELLVAAPRHGVNLSAQDFFPDGLPVSFETTIFAEHAP